MSPRGPSQILNRDIPFMSETDFQAPELEVMNTLLPAFEFGQILSANEWGAVYYAIQKSLDRYVAVKVFSPALGQDERFMESYARSNSMVAGLRHPNLITVFDTGVIEGLPYIVMEFVQGKSLHRSMRGRIVELDPALGIIREVCEGIAHAHERGLIHGNLDPLSILLNQVPSPKIGNFALCGSIHTTSEAEPPEHFKAPEIHAGEAPTQASDLYSIGAIFYELITGCAYGADAPPASSLAQLPRAIDRVIEMATAFDPAERGADVLAFYRHLQQAAGNGPKKVSLPVAVRRAPMVPGAAMRPAGRTAIRPQLKSLS
ncbi:MAG TPA: serine/threonine-protein kinase [Luteolibacter sp.]|nr:serine/threonine-protein kinase [Luteolibacter sp.]